LISSFLDKSSLSLTSEDKSYIYSLIPSQIKLIKVFENGDLLEFRTAVENKKAVLIICKTDKTTFGLLIIDPIDFDASNICSHICAFNVKEGIKFTGKG